AKWRPIAYRRFRPNRSPLRRQGGPNTEAVGPPHFGSCRQAVRMVSPDVNVDTQKKKKRPTLENRTSLIVQEGARFYAEAQLVSVSCSVCFTVRSTSSTTARLLAGPIPPFRAVCSRRPERAAGSARLGRDWQACGPPGRGWEHGAHIRRVRSEAHGKLPCLRHY